MLQSYFSVACYVEGGDYEKVRLFFAYFQHFPSVIFVFNLALGVTLSDLYYFFSSIVQLAAYYYLSGLSYAVRSERPSSFDYVLCRKPQYALPDALFVTSIMYVIVISCGLMCRRSIARKIGILYKLIFCVVPIFYAIGLYVNDYFTLWQLFVNTALAFFASFFYVYLYWLLVGMFNLIVGWRHWFANIFGFESIILARVPDVPDNEAKEV